MRDRDKSATPNAGRIPRGILISAAVAGLLGVLWAGYWFGGGYLERKRDGDEIRLQLPALPDTTGWPKAFAVALRDAESKISGTRDLLQGIRDLCMLFHANGFLEEAAACYPILAERKPREPRWPYLQALLALDRGDLASGVNLLETTLALDPDAIHAMLKLGAVRAKSNEPELASEAYRSCLLLEANNPYALLGLARDRMRSDQLADAGSLLDRLVEQNPEFAPGYMLMAQLHEKRGETRKAEVALAFGEERDRYNEPPDPWMDEVMDRCYDIYRLTVRADTDTHAGRHDSAGRILDRAATLAPGDPEVLTLRGFHQQRLGKMDDAAQSFQSAINLPGHSSDAYFGLARVFLTRGDRNSVIDTARKGLEAFPDSAKINAMLGEFLLHADSPAQAERHLNIALKSDPFHHKAIKSLANLRLKQGRKREAMEKFEEVRRLAPRDVSSRLALAGYYAQNGRFDQAEAPLREAAELKPEDAKLREFAIEILLENADRKVAAGFLAGAVENFQEAMSLDPDRVDLYRRMAIIRAKLQDWDGAAGNLKTYLDQRPDDAGTWVLLGDVYWSAGKPSEARNRWLHAQRRAQMQTGAEKLLDVINARLSQPETDP